MTTKLNSMRGVPPLTLPPSASGELTKSKEAIPRKSGNIATTKKKIHIETWDSHELKNSKLATPRKKKIHIETWDSHELKNSKLATPRKKKIHIETWDSHELKNSKLATPRKKKIHIETWDSHELKNSKLATPRKKKIHIETWDSHELKNSKLATPRKKKIHIETWDSHELKNSKLATPRKKKIHIETWGCQMNVADSERILALMARQNYVRAESELDAQLIVLNTCHIREKATHKVISRLGRLRRLKEENHELKIAVVGCVAQAEGKRLLQEVPYIDYVLGPAKIELLPAIITGTEQVSEDKQAGKDNEISPALSGRFEVSRFINIMQGCNNYCTFCVVPFTRGREKSQTQAHILAQARRMVATGVKEITLLGQNVNSYGQDLYPDRPNPFVDLLTQVCQIEELESLRFTTSNPHDFTHDLIDLFAQQKKLGRYVHLPIQSGSDKVLQEMKRKVTVSRILEITEALRAGAEDFAISTDIIVGFPAETEDDFAQTLDIIRRVRFSFIFSFKYSPRRHTPAARFRDQIPEEVKSRRLTKLQQTQKEITTELNQQEIGQQRQVLVHYKSKKEENIYYGRTPHFRLVRISSTRDITGATLQVLIIAANATSLVGEICQ